MKNKSEVSTGSDIDPNILFNLSEEIQCIINTFGYFEKVNQRFIQQSGLTEPKLLTSDLLSIIHPKDKERVNKILLTLASGSTAKFEAHFIQPKSPGKAFTWKAMALDDNIYLSAKSIGHQILVARELQQSLTDRLVNDSSLGVLSSVGSDDLPSS